MYKCTTATMTYTRLHFLRMDGKLTPHSSCYLLMPLQLSFRIGLFNHRKHLTKFNEPTATSSPSLLHIAINLVLAGNIGFFMDKKQAAYQQVLVESHPLSPTCNMQQQYTGCSNNIQTTQHTQQSTRDRTLLLFCFLQVS
jgi:hypothetical protein